MSELNNEKKSHFGLKEFAIIYAMTAIAITIVNMFFYQETGTSFLKYISKNYTNKEENEKEIVSNKIETQEIVQSNVVQDNTIQEVKKLVLTDKYYINNIEFTDQKIVKGNIIDYDYEGNPNYKLTATYVQISGLKDKNIEEKINREIREKTESLIVDEEIYDDSITNINIFVNNVFANFNDVISVCGHKSVQYCDPNNTEYYYKDTSSSLNFRLDTGELLELEDIFTKNASIKNLLSQAYYRNLAFEYGLDMDIGSGDLSEIDYGKIENEVFNYVSKFNTQGEDDFYFNYNMVSVIIDGKYCSIDLQECPEYVAIYNLVNAEESLYENGNLEKNNYVLGPDYFANLEYFGKVGENNFLSIYNYYRQDGELSDYDKDDYPYEYTNTLIDNIEEIKKAIEKDSKKEDGKAYIYHIEYYNIEDETNVFSGEKIEVDFENFEENIEKIYAMGARQPMGGEFILSLFNITEDKNYEGNRVFSIMIKDNDNDGSLDVGQKLVTPDDWNAYYEAECEF